MRPFHRSLLALLAALPLASCVGAPTDDDASDNETEALAGDLKSINIGFNGGTDQFGYFDDFFKSKGAVAIPGPHVCHWYVPWNVAQPGTATTDLTYLKGWLRAAEGHCSEALISFKADAPGAPPTQAEYKAAFIAFVDTPWATETGFTGAFSFTPWNEPNNPEPAGSGLGKALTPEQAATYYLTAEHQCASRGCKVAAGDFASNSTWWDAFEWNCANDNVAAADLCKSPSSENTGGLPASYLDRYKNYIVNHAANYFLGDGFRPKYFAFHGWHDVNEYLDHDSACGSYGDCATRRLLQSLGGSWSHVEIWDTEVGMGQKKAYSDPEQACGAAFLLRLTALDRRITRLYYTRLHGGNEHLLDDHAPRLALHVLAERNPSLAGKCAP
jgi:hypothetical protein